jgi:Flp pilus assembly protein TadD
MIRILFVVCWVVGLGACVPATKERVPSANEQAKATQLLTKGAQSLENRQLDKAAAEFRMARELAPSAESWDGLGCVALLRGDLDRAEKLFLRALDMNEGYYNVYSNLALLEMARGRLEVARHYFKKSIDLDRMNARSRANYAILKRILGEPDALEVAEEAVELGGREKAKLLVKKLKKERER